MYHRLNIGAASSAERVPCAGKGTCAGSSHIQPVSLTARIHKKEMNSGNDYLVCKRNLKRIGRIQEFRLEKCSWIPNSRK